MTVQHLVREIDGSKWPRVLTSKDRPPQEGDFAHRAKRKTQTDIGPGNLEQGE